MKHPSKKIIYFEKMKYGFLIWFNFKPKWFTKSIRVSWMRKPWKEVGNKPRFYYHDNGARKGIDSCFDCTIHLGYLLISYTNWDYLKGSFK